MLSCGFVPVKVGGSIKKQCLMCSMPTVYISFAKHNTLKISMLPLGAPAAAFECEIDKVTLRSINLCFITRNAHATSTAHAENC